MNPNENQQQPQPPVPEQPIPTEQPGAPYPPQEQPSSEMPQPSPFANQAPVGSTETESSVSTVPSGQSTETGQPQFEQNFVSQVAPVESQPVAPSPFNQPQTAEPMAPQPVAPQSSKSLAIAALVLAILGFFTAFIGIGILLALVGVILGIVSLVKHKGGKGLSIAAVIVGGISVVFGGIFLAITLIAYSGITSRANASATKSEAMAVLMRVESYNAKYATATANAYPTYDQLVSATDADVALNSEVKQNLHEGDGSAVNKSAPIAYTGCTEGGTVYYWDPLDSVVKTEAAGDPSQC